MKGKKIIPLLLAAAMGISVLAGCGNSIDATKTGATLDGEEISLGFMNFMARYQQAIYDGQFSGMFGTGFWSQDLFGEGTDTETSVKKNVAENIETLYLLERHMEDYKVEITEDEQAKMQKAAEKFMADNSKEAIAQMGATQEYVEEMLRLNTIQNKMRKAIDAEVDTEVSDEEAAQKTISYVRVGNTTTTDEEGNSKEYTEEEKENLKKEVESFAASAKDDFAAAAETAGYTVSKESYGAGEETLDAALIEAADKLKDGELSGVITGEDAFYVVRMDSTFDEEETEKRKDEIVTERKNDHYTEICDQYKEGVKFELNEKEWEKVKFDDLFTIKQPEDSEAEEDAAGDSADTEEDGNAGESENAGGDADTEEDGNAGEDTSSGEDENTGEDTKE